MIPDVRRQGVRTVRVHRILQQPEQPRAELHVVVDQQNAIASGRQGRFDPLVVAFRDAAVVLVEDHVHAVGRASLQDLTRLVARIVVDDEQQPVAVLLGRAAIQERLEHSSTVVGDGDDAQLAAHRGPIGDFVAITSMQSPCRSRSSRRARYCAGNRSSLLRTMAPSELRGTRFRFR